MRRRVLNICSRYAVPRNMLGTTTCSTAHLSHFAAVTSTTKPHAITDKHFSCLSLGRNDFRFPSNATQLMRYFFSKVTKEQRNDSKTTEDTSVRDSSVSESRTSANENAGDSTKAGTTPMGKDSDDLKKQFDAEKQDMNAKLADVVDKYKRSLAEMENLRTRLTKQVQDARVFGIQSFCKDLLDVADVMAKAAESLPAENAVSSGELLAVVNGLRATENKLQQVFQRHGLVKINPLNEKFDPNFHEALFQIPAQDGQESGQVVIVEKVGYKLKERCLRPAVVGVAKA